MKRILVAALFVGALFSCRFVEAATPCIKHTFVSPKDPSTDPTIVDGPKWNECHNIEDGSIGPSNLTFNPATQAELDAHAAVNAAADGVTKGHAGFNANDFNAASGIIGLDYLNGQKANGSQPGFLSSADWINFNAKPSPGPITSSGFTQGNNRILGRSTAGTGPVEELIVGAGLALSAGTLSSPHPPIWQFSIADEIADEAVDSGGSGNFSVGTRFKAVRSGVVLTGIRFHWVGGLGARTVDVKLFTTGSKSDDSAFSTTVAAASVAVNAAGFYTGVFSSPQTLVKNQWYAVTGYDTSGSNFMTTVAATSVPGVPTAPFFDGAGLLWRGRALKAGSHAGPDTFDFTSWHAVEPVVDLTQ